MDPLAILRWAMAATALAAGGYHAWHALRQRHPSRPGRDVDLTHAAMGLGMAVMLAFSLDLVTVLVLVAGFAITTLWYALRALDTYVENGARSASLATRQLLCCIAMTGMLAVSLIVGGHSMSGGATTMPVGASHATHGGHVGTGVIAGPVDPKTFVLSLLVIQLVVVAWTARSLIPRPTTHMGAQLAIGVSGVTMLALML